MTETEKAYIAGFVDGEGCIQLQKKKVPGQYCLRFRITQTDKPILDWIQLCTGHGTVRRWSLQSERHKERYEWYCGGEKALEILYAIYPYLKLKKLQAEIAFKFGKTMQRSGHHLSEDNRIYRQSLREAMDELHGHKHTKEVLNGNFSISSNQFYRSNINR